MNIFEIIGIGFLVAVGIVILVVGILVVTFSLEEKYGDITRYK